MSGLHRWAWVGAVLALACGEPSSAGAPEPAPESKSPKTPESKAEAKVAPTKPVIESTAIAMHNGTGQVIELDQSVGAATPLSLIDIRGEQAPLAVLMSPHPCACPCDELSEDRSCPCESQGDRISLSAGQSHVVRWDGRVRRQRLGASGRCFEAADAVPGHYLVRACDARGRACATAEIELPLRDETIDLLLSSGLSATPDCSDRTRVERAVRVTMAAAQLEGVPAETFDGCEPSGATCAEHSEALESEGCTIEVVARPDTHRVRIVPAPRQGSPREVRGWVDADAIAAGRVEVEASRWGVTSNGAARAVGLPRRISHTHGGTPAMVGSVSFEVINTLEVPVPLRVQGLKWSSTLDCAPPGNEGTPMTPSSVTVDGGPSVAASEEMTLAPGTSSLSIGFEPRSAYQTHCRRFGVVAELAVDGVPLEASAEIHVVRRTPRRP